MSMLKGLKWPGWSKPVLMLAALVLLAWLPLVGMDFWQDDRALIFKLQHPYQSAGLFGNTLWGQGPYSSTAAIVYPFWPLFHLNPAGYFASSIVVYFIATLVVWWFATVLFERKDLALVMASLFAVSHFGADGMLRIINSFQNLLGLMGAAATIGLLITHIKTRNLFWYALALLMYLGTVGLIFIRSSGLILAVIGVDLAFSLLRRKGKLLNEIIGLMIRQTPFVIAFVKSYGLGSSASERISQSSLESITKAGLPKAIGSLVTSFGNLVVPDRITGLFTQNLDTVQMAIGILALATIGAIILTQWKKQPHLARVMIFGTIATFAFFIPNWLQYPVTPFNTTHRYLTSSLLGSFAIATACIVFIHHFLSRRLKTLTLKNIATVPVLILVGLNLQYQISILNNRAIPSKRFYRDLHTRVPHFEKGSLIYFDIEETQAIKDQFRNFFAVGSMPDETALAIYYDIDRYDIKFPESIDELVSIALQQHTPIEKIYLLRYSGSGLENRSQQFRDLLAHGTTIDKGDLTFNDQGSRIAAPEPIERLPAQISFDYIFQPTIPRLPAATDTTETNTLKLLRGAQFLTTIRNTMKITASSQWRFHEIVNINDNNPDTSWLGHRIHFHDEKQETLEFDFGSPQLIGELWWVNGSTSRTATSYTITAADRDHWNTIVTKHNLAAQPSGGLIKERFAPLTTNKLRLTITETEQGDAPEIAEIYPLAPMPQNATVDDLYQTLKNPFSYVSSTYEFETAQKLLNTAGIALPMAVGTPSKQLSLLTFVKPGTNHLTIDVPSGFERLDPIAMGPLGIGSAIKLMHLKIVVPNLATMAAHNLVKNFSDN